MNAIQLDGARKTRKKKKTKYHHHHREHRCRRSWVYVNDDDAVDNLLKEIL